MVLGAGGHVWGSEVFSFHKKQIKLYQRASTIVEINRTNVFNSKSKGDCEGPTTKGGGLAVQPKRRGRCLRPTLSNKAIVTSPTSHEAGGCTFQPC